jgi:hypothetical protein
MKSWVSFAAMPREKGVRGGDYRRVLAACDVRLTDLCTPKSMGTRLVRTCANSLSRDDLNDELSSHGATRF